MESSKMDCQVNDAVSLALLQEIELKGIFVDLKKNVIQG